MSMQTKTIGRMPTDHGPYDPQLAYGKKFQCTLFGCAWESLHDNNNTAPAVWDGGDIITPNLVDWKKVSGSYEAWLMNKDKPASTGTTGDYPYNGMGRVVIPKKMVNGVNTLTHEAFEDSEGNDRENTIYVIQYDFTLGEDIRIPANCVLEFDGGSISASGNNDTITFNNTAINASKKAFNGCRFQGTCANDIAYSNLFGVVPSTDVTDLLNDLVQISKHLYITSGEYLINGVDTSVEDAWSTNTGIILKSNFILELDKDCTLKLIYNSHNVANIISCFRCENVIITGGTIIGDKDRQTYQSDFSYGIWIGGSKNIEVSNMIIDKCNGDSINLQLWIRPEPYAGIVNENIRIINCVLSNAGRNCCSIEAVKHVVFENCTMFGAGGTYPDSNPTPGCGILIEPYTTDFGTIVEDVVVTNSTLLSPFNSVIWQDKDIKIYNSTIVTLTFASKRRSTDDDYQTDISLRNVLITGTLHIFMCKNVNIDSCTIDTLYVSSKCKEINIHNNSIRILSTYTEAIEETARYTKDIIIVGNIITGGTLYVESGLFSNNIIKGTDYSFNVSKNLVVSDNQFNGGGYHVLGLFGSGVCKVQDNIFVNPSLLSNGGEVIACYSGGKIVFENNEIVKNAEGGNPTYYLTPYGNIDTVVFFEPEISLGRVRTPGSVTTIRDYVFTTA